jgi:hypothetical protein
LCSCVCLCWWASLWSPFFLRLADGAAAVGTRDKARAKARFSFFCPPTAFVARRLLMLRCAFASKSTWSRAHSRDLARSDRESLKDGGNSRILPSERRPITFLPRLLPHFCWLDLKSSRFVGPTNRSSSSDNSTYNNASPCAERLWQEEQKEREQQQRLLERQVHPAAGRQRQRGRSVLVLGQPTNLVQHRRQVHAAAEGAAVGYKSSFLACFFFFSFFKCRCRCSARRQDVYSLAPSQEKQCASVFVGAEQEKKGQKEPVCFNVGHSRRHQ